MSTRAPKDMARDDHHLAMGDIETTERESICNPRRLRISAAPVFMRRSSMMPMRPLPRKNILGNGSETHELDSPGSGYDAYRLQAGRVLLNATRPGRTL